MQPTRLAPPPRARVAAAVPRPRRPIVGERRFVAIDFETADNGRDSACAVAIVVVQGSQIVEQHYSLLRPPRRHFLHSGIHGITWAQVATAPSFGEHWTTLAPLLRGSAFIAAHNAPFDKGVLHACCGAAQVTPPNISFKCTMLLARSTWGIRPTTLPDVCSHLSIDLDHHDALSDALACAHIVIAARECGTSI